jgi:hypothetical protein
MVSPPGRAGSEYVSHWSHEPAIRRSDSLTDCGTDESHGGLELADLGRRRRRSAFFVASYNV